MGITDKKIKSAVSGGASTVKQLRDQLGVASCCGKCAGDARELIFDTLLTNSADMQSRRPVSARSVGQATANA